MKTSIFVEAHSHTGAVMGQASHVCGLRGAEEKEQRGRAETKGERGAGQLCKKQQTNRIAG